MELHRFAQSIGIKREWYQDNPHTPHYDLTYGKRRQAIAAGAVVTHYCDWWQAKRAATDGGREIAAKALKETEQ